MPAKARPDRPQQHQPRKAPVSRGLVYLRPTHLVFIRRTGDYAHAAREAWTELVAWMDANGVPRQGATYFGLARDNPMKVEADKCRFDACIEAPANLEGSAALDTVQRQRLPGGSYARHAYVGRYGRELREKTLALCTDWVSTQGLRLADERPSVIILRNDPLMAGERTAKAEICIPVSPLAQRGTKAA